MATFMRANILCAARSDSFPQLPVRPRIVVVDDSPELLDVVCAVLKSQYEVEIIGRGKDGQEALEMAAMLRPDLIIMDIRMPRMDGLVACSLISMRYPAISVLLMSGEESSELRSQAHTCGARTFIFKPKFASAIAEVLGTLRRKARTCSRA